MRARVVRRRGPRAAVLLPGPAGSQPPAVLAGGAEVPVGITHEPVFRPLVVLGPGGMAAGVLADHRARLTVGVLAAKQEADAGSPRWRSSAR